MGQESRFWYFPLDAFNHLRIAALFTACLAIIRFPACFPFSPPHFWYISKSGWSGFIKTSLFYPRAWNAKFKILETMPVKTPAKWMNQSGWPYCSVSVARFFWQATHVADCDSFCFPLPWSKTWASEEKRKIFQFLPIPLFFRFSLSTDFQLFFDRLVQRTILHARGFLQK